MGEQNTVIVTVSTLVDARADKGGQKRYMVNQVVADNGKPENQIMVMVSDAQTMTIGASKTVGLGGVQAASAVTKPTAAPALVGADPAAPYGKKNQSMILPIGAKAPAIDLVFVDPAAIILPDQATRSKDDLFNVWGGTAHFDNFFDEAWFMEAINASCPQLTIHKTDAGEQWTHIDGRYSPRSRRTYAEPTWTKASNIEEFNAWLKSRPNYDAGKTSLVEVGRTLWEHDTRALPKGVRRTMGTLLRVTPAVRRMAGMIVQELGKEYGIDMDPRQEIPGKKFFGAHLRTESDAAAAGWLNAPNRREIMYCIHMRAWEVVATIVGATGNYWQAAYTEPFDTYVIRIGRR